MESKKYIKVWQHEVRHDHAWACPVKKMRAGKSSNGHSRLSLSACKCMYDVEMSFHFPFRHLITPNSHRQFELHCPTEDARTKGPMKEQVPGNRSRSSEEV